MKTNKIIPIAIGLIAAGVILFIIGFCMLGGDFRKLSSEPELEKKVYASAEKINSIEIDAGNVSVDVRPSPNDEVIVTYNENRCEYYDISVQDGRLTINNVNNREWYEYIMVFNLGGRYITVEVPDYFAGDIDIDVSNKDIVIENISAASVKLEDSNDDIILNNVDASGAVKVHNSNGDVSFTRCSIGEELNVRNSNGPVKLTDLSAASLIIDGSMSRINLTRVKTDLDAFLDTSNKNIEFLELEVGTKLTCDNSNGAIIGSLHGNINDFTISTDVSNGDCNMPQDMKGGDKLLELETSNDDIEITFLD